MVCGRLCGDCKHGKCVDIGTELEPHEMECPSCGGDGCSHCDEGRLVINGCPQRQLGDAADLVQLSRLYDKGLPPVAGGSLDQAYSFVEACRYFNAQVTAIREQND